MVRKGQTLFPVAVPLALALLTAACTSSSSPSDGQASGDTPGPAVAAEGSVEGCGEESWTDPSTMSPDRAVARCESGAPAPQPLDEPATVTISTSTTGAEYFAPIAMGIETGEFEKENLTVNIENLPPSDSYPLLSNGQIDATWTSPDASFVNAVNSGFDLRWVLGNYSPPQASKSGIWVRTENGEPIALSQLGANPIGSVVGKGSVITYPIDEALEADGSNITEVEFQSMGAADIVTALENGGLQAAWVLDPLWTSLEGNPDLAFVSGQNQGEPLGGMVMGTRLLRDEPEVGEAFVRAFVRTINTHLSGDYKDDPETLATLSRILELPEETLEATPSLIFDWEIRGETMQNIQETLIEVGSVELQEALPEEQLIDRSFYSAAVGHESE